MRSKSRINGSSRTCSRAWTPAPITVAIRDWLRHAQEKSYGYQLLVAGNERNDKDGKSHKHHQRREDGASAEPIREHAGDDTHERSEQDRDGNEESRLRRGKVKSFTKTRSERANQPPRGETDRKRDGSER